MGDVIILEPHITTPIEVEVDSNSRSMFVSGGVIHVGEIPCRIVSVEEPDADRPDHLTVRVKRLDRDRSNDE